MTLLAGFCVAEDAVAEQLTPFADAAREATLASQESLMAWVFFLQRRDEQRHARLFDRIAAEVLGLPGADAGRAARRGPRARPGRRCSSCSRSGCRRWPPSSRRGAPG